MTTRQPPAAPGSLAAYLHRAGLPLEAAMAKADLSDPQQRLKLEAALRKQKKTLPVSPEPDEMVQLFRFLFGDAADLDLRRLEIGPGTVPAAALGINGMVDRQVIERALAAIQTAPDLDTAPTDGEALLDWLALQHSSIPGTNTDSRVDKLLRHLTDGHVVIFIRGARRALVWVVQGFQRRPVAEPPTEGVVRGPREGFTENLSDNTSMIRRRVRDERLRIEEMILGEVTGTRVALLYVSGICRPELVAEARERLGRIKTDAILDTGYIQEFIEDTPWTLFPLSHSTERPDVVSAALLEGRFAIVVDGSPFAMVAPTTFNALMQAPEDYYERFPIVALVRILRWAFASVALLGPSFYVAFTTYHHEMLPTTLLLSIMAAREGVPFPAIVEALIMEIAFEALREAGIRMPKQIGQAISIVGALVIGQSAVMAGIVSAPMVIVVSLTGLASFLIPNFGTSISLRILRFIMLALAGTFGAFGITLGVIVVLIHLLSLRSFGVAYYSPMGPLVAKDLDDAMIRAPHWAGRTRPAEAKPLDPIRKAPGQMPYPGKGEKK